jgi:hypothetical protein
MRDSSFPENDQLMRSSVNEVISVHVAALLCLLNG